MNPDGWRSRIWKGVFISPRCPPTKLSNFRLIREIERTLGRGANTPHTKYNKEMVEGYKLEIQEILGVLDSQSSPLDESLGETRSTAPVAPVTSGSTAAASRAESGASSTSPSQWSHGILIILRFDPMSQLHRPSLQAFDRSRVRPMRTSLLD